MKILLMIMSLIIAVLPVYAGGLYNQTNAPIAGEVVSYRRMPYAEIVNTLDNPISINMTTETVKLYPDSSITATFLRRLNLSADYFAGKNIPLFNPQTGLQVGYMTTDLYYAMTYSIWLAGEKHADGLLRFSDPKTIYYTTHGTDP